MLLANSAPSGMDVTLSVVANSSYMLAVPDFGFSDPADLNNFLAVEITTLPTAGKLTDNGSDVSAGQFIQVFDLQGNLKFTPEAAATGSPYTSFTFQVQDNGLTLGGGANLDPTPNTVTFNVIWMHHAPVGQDHTVTALEDTSYVFRPSDFPFTDPDDSPADMLRSVTIVTVPVLGTLTFNNGTTDVPVIPGQVIQASDISAGKLKFLGAPNAYGTPYTAFTFQIRDDGSTAQGGTNLDPTPHTQAINVRPVNDMPSGTDRQVTIPEDNSYEFSAPDFPISDIADSPPNTLKSVKITALPITGQLQLAGVPVALTDPPIPVAQLTSLRFVPGANLNDLNSSKPFFTFQVQDDGGTNVITGSDGSTASGIDTDFTPNTITISVASVPDVPQGGNNTITAIEDQTYAFQLADFPFSDANDNVGNGTTANGMIGVIITQPPASSTGVLKFVGNQVAQGQMIPANQISALTFTPTMNACGANSSNFRYQVVDNAATNNIEPAENAHTITIGVTPVNDPPASADHTVTDALEDHSYAFKLSDFPFSDPIDTCGGLPANNFAGIAIVTLPARGTLIFLPNGNGSVNIGQLVTANDIVTGNLQFRPNANDFGSAYSRFTFLIKDDGGTAFGGQDRDLVSRTQTINVLSVNDPPSGNDTTIYMLSCPSGTTHAFTASDFGFSDPYDSPANNMAAVIIVSPPAVPGLTYVGAPVTSLSTPLVIPVSNLSLLAFAEPSGTSPPIATFTFELKDNGGTLNGGLDTDPSPNTITIRGVPPPLYPSISRNVVINTLEDVSYVLGPTNFLIDDPNADLESIKITTLPAQGTLRLNGATFPAGTIIFPTDLASGMLVYTPPVDANGNNFASFTYTYRDNGGPCSSGVDYDGYPFTVTFNVASVNDPPQGINKTVTIQEDHQYFFSKVDFGFSDVLDNPPNTLRAVLITALPTNGTLTLFGVPVQQFDAVPANSISSLIFTPAANLNSLSPQVPIFTFAFQDQDNGGTAFGGSDLDPTPNTFTFNVDPVPDAPRGADNTVFATEDTDYTFKSTDFPFSDPSDNPPDTLAAVLITTLPDPATGILTLNNNPVPVFQKVPISQITSGQLKFRPAPNANGPLLGLFQFQVQDTGGTANGAGMDTDPTPARMTINVAPVNDAPYGQSNTVTTTEDTPYVFRLSDFGFSDPLDAASGLANSMAAVRIDLLPARGALLNNGAVVNVADEVTVSSIAAGMLSYVPPANKWGVTFANFQFQVRDDGGTANGGVNLDYTPRTMAINVTSVNDPPQGADKTVAISYCGSYIISAPDFGYSDPNDTPPSGTGPANNIYGVFIDTIPISGVLTDNGVQVMAGQFVSGTDIRNGLLRFTPPPFQTPVPLPNLTFRVQDDGGGQAVDLTPNSLTFNPIAPPLHAPVTLSLTAATLEDTPYTFKTTDFPITEDWYSQNLKSVRLTAISGGGWLTDNGSIVSIGAVIPAADITAGRFTYTPPANQSGIALAALAFDIIGDGGTCMPPFDDASMATMTINVTALNDPPSGADKAISILEETPYVINPLDFGFTDPNDSPANNFLAVKIATLPQPSAGTFTLNGVQVFIGQMISYADLAAGGLRFVPLANVGGAASISFQVEDDGGTFNGGIDLDPSPNTLTFNVTNCGEHPVGLGTAVTTPEDATYIFGLADFPLNDASDQLLDLRVTSFPPVGSLQVNGVAAVIGQPVSAADLASGKLRYIPPANASGLSLTSFSVQLDHSGSFCTPAGFDPTPMTVTMNVTAVNDPPSGTDNTVTTNEGRPYTFSAADFGFSDPDDSPPNTFLGIKITALPWDGLLVVIGLTDRVVGSGEFVAARDLGNLQYIPVANVHGKPLTSIYFQVQDSGGTALGGLDLDPTPNTITINGTSVNHAPSGSNNTVTTLEYLSYFFRLEDFGFTDPNDVPADNLAGIKIVTLPTRGQVDYVYLAPDGAHYASVTTGQFLSIPQLQSLQFFPVEGENGSPYSTFTFEVQDDGGTALGGVDLDPIPKTFTINVTPVNSSPNFLAGGNQLVTDKSGPQAVSDWAKQISRGPPDEAGQKVHFDVTSDNPALFATQPAVDGTGKLTFEPALKANGVAHVTVVAVDDGGTANGGIDTSQSQSFKIGVSLAEPMHNRDIAADVTGDGKVVAEDVVDVINFINASGSGPVAPAKPGDPFPALLYDVTGDNYIAADDVMAIINFINAHPNPQPQGEALTAETPTGSTEPSDALVMLLAIDSAQQAQRRK